MVLDVTLFTKGQARVAVDASDYRTQAQLQADGWQRGDVQAATTLDERMEQAAANDAPPQELVNRAALAVSTPTLGGQTMPSGWPPDLPGHLTSNLMLRYGTPQKAAQATDAELYQIGGMTPTFIGRIRTSGAVVEPEPADNAEG